MPNLEGYAVAHLNMAAAAERVVTMVAEHVFTPQEGIASLAEFASQYRDKLRALDARARPPCAHSRKACSRGSRRVALDRRERRGV